MRGENIIDGEIVARKEGSSPHARGKHIKDSSPDGELGLIPACAGKTVATSGRVISPWAHPRMRGENRGGLRK